MEGMEEEEGRWDESGVGKVQAAVGEVEEQEELARRKEKRRERRNVKTECRRTILI